MSEKIKISEFDYPLPDDRIAKFPVADRDASKLLVYRGGEISETLFKEVGRQLPEKPLLVFNNTKVIRARIIMRKPSGARIEILCLEPHLPADYERAFAVKGACEWRCVIGNLKKWKEGELVAEFQFGDGTCRLTAVKNSGKGSERTVRFVWDSDASFGEVLETLGRIPIPPYLNRESEAIDNVRYQTVYSRFDGSVAAPTAGLHFTPELIEDLKNSGISAEEVTLHVGAGTFMPVKDEDIEKHNMHTEHFEVTPDTVRNLIANTGGIIPVGTTSVRTLESLTVLGYRITQTGSPMEEIAVGQWEAYGIPAGADGKELLGALLEYMEREGLRKIKTATRIMIKPGYRYRVVDGMITNFHQPKSTLLLLVAAMIGDDWRKVYDYALGNGFRFLSYGDSSLLMKNRQ